MIAKRHKARYGTPGEGSLTRSVVEFVDVHCHCLPQLDDGPASMEEALALCRKLVEDHVSTVVATPHQLGRFENRADAQAIRRATRALNDELRRQGVRLAVLPGAEVRVDERIDAMLTRDQILTVADAGRYLLLELPWDALIDIEPLLRQLARRGVRVVVVHPERNLPLLRHPHVLQRWLACGVALQVTAASLTGDWGRHVRQAAWQLVAQGWADLVATDAHDDVAAPPRMTRAYEIVSARWGCERAYLLCVENPARVVRGERLARDLTRSQPAVS